MSELESLKGALAAVLLEIDRQDEIATQYDGNDGMLKWLWQLASGLAEFIDMRESL